MSSQVDLTAIGAHEVGSLRAFRFLRRSRCLCCCSLLSVAVSTTATSASLDIFVWHEAVRVFNILICKGRIAMQESRRALSVHHTFCPCHWCVVQPHDLIMFVHCIFCVYDVHVCALSVVVRCGLRRVALIRRPSAPAATARRQALQPNTRHFAHGVRCVQSTSSFPNLCLYGRHLAHTLCLFLLFFIVCSTIGPRMRQEKLWLLPSCYGHFCTLPVECCCRFPERTANGIGSDSIKLEASCPPPSS